MKFYFLVATLDNPFAEGKMVKKTTTLFTSAELALRWSDRFKHKLLAALKLPPDYVVNFSTEGYELVDYEPPT